MKVPFGPMCRMIYSDRLFKTTVWLFVAFAVSGLANYGYQVAMGRLLSPQDFAFLNTLLGVFVVLSVPVSTLLMVISRRTAEYYAQGNTAGVSVLFRRMNLNVAQGGAMGLAVWFLMSGVLSDYLRAPSLIPVALLGGGLFFAVMAPINTAVLQGLQEYRRFTFLQGAGGSLRFVLCVLPVFLGFGVNGALVGLMATNAVTWGLAWFFVRPYVVRKAGNSSVEPLVWKDAWPVLVANLAFAMMTQMDLIIVNRLFSSEEAARYAAAAVLGRTVIYIPGTLVMAMFPMVSEQQAKKGDALHLLVKSIALTLLLSGAGALIFWLAPGLVLEVLFGARYLASVGLLRYFGLAMLPMAVLMILYQYMAAHGRTDFSVIMLGGVVLEMILIGFFHDSLNGVLFAVGLVGALLCLIGLLRVRTNPISSGAMTYECA